MVFREMHVKASRYARVLMSAFQKALLSFVRAATVR